MNNKVKPRAGLTELLKKEQPQKLPAQKILDAAFWYPIIGREQHITNDGPKQREYLKDIGIDLLNFYNFLYSEGYRRFEFNEESIFIRIVNNKIIRKIKKVNMMDEIFNFLDLLPDTFEAQGYEMEKRQLKNVMIKRLDGLFADNRLLSQLRPKDPIVFNKDGFNTKYMYFLNGYLQISSINMQFKNYDQLEYYIWESQILPHDYNKPIENSAKDYARRFFFNVSGKNPERLKQLQNIIGYAMHDFTAYKLKALAFTDGHIDEDGEANGRSGKTLAAKMIGGAICANPYDQAQKTFVEINGKDFDPADKHKYDQCDMNTQLIVLNDVRKWFDVDNIYNDITEGISVNKKSLQPYKINAKMIVITNKTLKIEGDSSRDRFVEFEFSDHYNADFTPEKDFKHWFFRDWNNEDYMRYYAFMAECSQEFFKAGSSLVNPNQVNLNARKLIDLTSPDFIEYIEQVLKPDPERVYDKKDIYQGFINAFPDWAEKRKFAQRTLTKWLRYYVKYKEGFAAWNEAANEPRRNDGLRGWRFVPKKK